MRHCVYIVQVGRDHDALIEYMQKSKSRECGVCGVP